MPKRMRLVYSNLKKCYPDWSEKKIRNLAFESAARTVEMGLFVLASPYMKESELKKRFTLSESLKRYLEYYAENPSPIVLLVPHFCMMESITMLPILHEAKTPRTGVFYRPMNSKTVDDWVLKTRTKYGINLISRKAGLGKAFDFLKDNGTVAVLFDQSPNISGMLGYFFSRPCYTSNLAGLFAEKYKSDVGLMYAKRRGFFRAEIHAEMLDCKKDNVSVLIAGNEKLESLLKSDESLSADWLWLHDRWKITKVPSALLNLNHPKNICKETKPSGNIKRNEIFINLPKTEQSIADCVGLIRELSVSREDALIVLLVEKDLKDYVSSFNIGDEIMLLPSAKEGFFKYFKAVKALQNRYINLLIDFNPEQSSLRKKLKAFRNIAISLGKKKQKKYEYPKVRGLEKMPQSEQYRAMFEYFGLPKQK